MTLIKEIKQTWKPDLHSARIHVKMTIKHYSQLDKLLFYKQLDITFRGLIVVGFSERDAMSLMREVLIIEEVDFIAWINERTTSEIIAS